MTPTTHANTIQASSPAEVASAVKTAIRTGVAITDYGIAHMGLGNPPAEHCTRLTQTGSVIEHYVDDMAVRVAGGCTMAELARTLEQAGQFLPLDADDDLTISEIISHNVYGPMRAGYGSARDLLLGLTFVDGQGRQVGVGGRTVKNVAGYDVTRLMVGSLGELGVITEAVLRTYALPVRTRIVDLQLDDPQVLDDVMTAWLTTDAAPVWLQLTCEQDNFTLHLGYHGSSLGGMAQVRSLETLIDKTPDVHIAASQEYDYASDARERAAHRVWRRYTAAIVKVIVPPASTGFVCHSLAHAPAGQPMRQIEADPAHGCIFVGGNLSAQQAQQLDQQIQHLIQPAGGFRVWYQRPSDALTIPPVSPAQPDWALLGRIKRTLDPHNILNPGRLLPQPPSDEPARD